MYLLRHGATANNLAKPPRLQGQGLDAPLSQVGREQAKQTAAFLIARDIPACTAARLSERATAEIMPPGAWIPWPPSHTHDTNRRSVGGPPTKIEENDRESPPLSNPPRSTATRWRFLAASADAGRARDAAFDGRKSRTANRRRDPQCSSIQCLAHLLGLPAREARSLSQENCGTSIVRLRGGKMKLLTMNSFIPPRQREHAAEPKRSMITVEFELCSRKIIYQRDINKHKQGRPVLPRSCDLKCAFSAGFALSPNMPVSGQSETTLIHVEPPPWVGRWDDLSPVRAKQ